MQATFQVLFEEHQQFRQTWLWALLLGVFVMLLVILGLAIFQATDLQGIVGIAVGIGIETAVVALMYMLKLSVRLDSEGLHIRFFPLVNRHVPLDQIARWEARTYHPILEYGGWGIRCGWKGMAYNVSGNKGVQLELANGNRILIGSQRAEELARAISDAKGR